MAAFQNLAAEHTHRPEGSNTEQLFGISVCVWKCPNTWGAVLDFFRESNSCSSLAIATTKEPIFMSPLEPKPKLVVRGLHIHRPVVLFEVGCELNASKNGVDKTGLTRTSASLFFPFSFPDFPSHFVIEGEGTLRHHSLIPLIEALWLRCFPIFAQMVSKSVPISEEAAAHILSPC